MARLSWLLVLLSSLACGNVKKGGGGDGDGSPGGDGDGAPAGKQRLTVTVEGSGTVTSDPPGIECPETCTADFDEGVEVTLTTTPNSDSGLAGWDGDCGGLAPTCALTMDASRAAAAIFDLHGAARWVGHISFEGQDWGESDIVLDSAGNPIVAGRIEVAAGPDIYVRKLDRLTGDTIWENHIETTSGEYAGGLAIDADDNVYLSFTSLGFESVVIGGETITVDLGGTIVVTRLAADTGDFDWVKQWGGGGQDRPHSMVVLGTNLFVVGETSSNPGDFGGMPIEGSTGDGFVVKARTDNGNVLAAKRFDGNWELNAIAASGSFLGIGGYFYASSTIDAGCSVSISGGGGDSDGWVAQLATSDLDCKWVRDFGDSTVDMSASTHGIAAHPDGGWVATGAFQGNVLWAESGSSLGSRGGFDAFAVRYAANGDHVWSFRYGDISMDVGEGVAVTAGGHTILSGRFESEITFGAIELDGAKNVFVTRMSPGATPGHEWAVSLGGDDYDWAYGLAVDGEENVYVGATFTGQTNVDGTPLTAADYDGWLAALVR